MSLYTVSINGIIYAEHLPMHEATCIADDFREEGQDVKIEKEDENGQQDKDWPDG